MFRVRSRKPAPAKTLTPILCDAIKRKCLVSCVYDDGQRRSVEPYCHGYSRAGVELLSAFQVAGPSEPGWKMFEVGKLAQIELTDEPFATRPDFNPISPGMGRVHCQ